jgi:N6-adenosine-specific RNA methylase IME4
MIDTELAAIHAYEEQHATCDIQQHPWLRNHVFRGRRDVRSVQRWSQRYDKNHGKRHSAKPEGAIDLIEEFSPAPYVELFARRHRLGWDVWRNESANSAIWSNDAQDIEVAGSTQGLSSGG